MSEKIEKRPANFSETAIEDEIVVMRLATGDFFSLTGTGRDIWLLIDGTRSRGDLVAALAAQYDCPEDAIASDIQEFLAQLAAADLIAGG